MYYSKTVTALEDEFADTDELEDDEFSLVFLFVI